MKFWIFLTERGARRWGQRSSRAIHFEEDWSFQMTRSRLRSWNGVGTVGSRSSMSETAYQWSLHEKDEGELSSLCSRSSSGVAEEEREVDGVVTWMGGQIWRRMVRVHRRWRKEGWEKWGMVVIDLWRGRRVTSESWRKRRGGVATAIWKAELRVGRTWPRSRAGGEGENRKDLITSLSLQFTCTQLLVRNSELLKAESDIYKIIYKYFLK